MKLPKKSNKCIENIRLDSPLEYITGYDVRDLIYSTLESDYLLSDEKHIGEKS